jgi:hypothetical protein
MKITLAMPMKSISIEQGEARKAGLRDTHKQLPGMQIVVSVFIVSIILMAVRLLLSLFTLGVDFNWACQDANHNTCNEHKYLETIQQLR